jgi:amino acid adenylation domain-containing protein
MAPQSEQASRLHTNDSVGMALPEPFRKWSGAASDYPRNRTVASLFEEIAASRPHTAAISFNENELTYSELNRRANRIAHHLRALGVGPEVIVGCCLERSPELIIALLAILKAGGAYVPLDPAYPNERFNFLLDDTRTPLILTQRRIASTVLRYYSQPLVSIDDFGQAPSPRADDLNPASTTGANSLAYVMYTSGSTGRPKGVLVENRAIVRLVRNTNYCKFTDDQVFLQFAPISFDASTFEIWGPLLNGARLVIAPPGASSLLDLGNLIRANGVTTLWLTSGLFNLMVEQRLEDLRPIRQLLVGGEALSPRHVRICLEALPDTSLINGYGPTENTTFTCCHVLAPGDAVANSVPIGKPISNTQVFILDTQLQPRLPGEPGELYTAGDGLARGYLNDPEETTRKFMPNPFSANGERMYRTGDLARWRNDGTIEFLGRLDDQVKISGYRIEPSEIEATLRAHASVKQSCVLVFEDEHCKRLVAFYVPTADAKASPAEIRQYVASKLPHYMIPVRFTPLSSFPLTPHGKIDRRALAEFHSGAKAHSALPLSSPVSPARETQLEASLMQLWQEVLRCTRVDLDDNFFDLGGNSLLLLAMHAKLGSLTSRKIPIIDLFKYPTLRKLARYLSAKGSAAGELEPIHQRVQTKRRAVNALRARRGGGA